MTSKRSSAVVQIAVNGTTAAAGSPPLVHAGGVSNPSRVGLNNNASGGLMASMVIDVEEARSPRGGGGRAIVVNYDDDDSEEDLLGIWENVLNRASFPPEHVKEYSATLSKQLVDLQLFSGLSNEDLNHLNIRLGHRKRIRRVVADAIVVREKQRAQSIAPRNALAGGFPKKHSIDDSSSPPHAGLTVSNSVAECAAEQDEYMARFPNSKLFYSQQHDITWLRVSGSWPSYTEFIDDMKTMRAYKGFPMSFDRLLFDDKPMPFFVTDNSDTMLGLLLRIPDLTDRYGTSVASITNRLVFMANFDQRFLLTYHNCAVNPLKVFEADWEKNLFTQKTLPQLLDSATRRALKAYSVGVFQMREEMDDLMAENYDGSEVDRVQGLTRIQKKAGVYKRCSEGCRDVISQLDRFETIAPYTKTLCEGLSTVESMADEAQSNALSSIDLTIAISEFKGSFNLKIFTYMTILLQPVSVMTSWYGMNWSNMPELLEENGYFIFTGIIWAVALVIFVMIVFGPDWISQLRPYFMHDAPRIVDEDESLDASKGDAMTPTGKKEKRESGIALLSLPVAIGSGESTSSTSQRPADKHENSGSGKLFSPLGPEQTSHNVLAGPASDGKPLPTSSGDDDAAEIFPFIAEDAQSVDMSR